MVKKPQEEHIRYLGHGLLAEPVFVEAFLGRELRTHSHVLGRPAEVREYQDGVEPRLISRNELGFLSTFATLPEGFRLYGLAITRNPNTVATLLRLNLSPLEYIMIRALNFGNEVFNDHPFKLGSNYIISELKTDYINLGVRIDGAVRPRRALGIHKAELADHGRSIREEIRANLGLPAITVENMQQGERHGHGVER